MPADLSPDDHVWVAIDVAAEALGCSVRRAQTIANQESWRRSLGRATGRRGRRPRQYFWPDIVTTYNRRRDPQ